VKDIAGIAFLIALLVFVFWMGNRSTPKGHSPSAIRPLSTLEAWVVGVPTLLVMVYNIVVVFVDVVRWLCHR
jgi:hypothetical protein